MAESTGIPTQAVHEAHLATLSARQRVASADDPTASGAHRELQRTIAGYFDTLRPYLVGQSEGKDYYQGEIPDSLDGDGVAILDADQREEEYQPQEFEKPPEDASPEAKRDCLLDQVPTDDNELAAALQVDEDGTVRVLIAEYVVGLKTLEELYSARSETIIEPDGWRADADPKSQVELDLMDLDMLMRASRLLDEAAHALEFLPRADERPGNKIAGA